MALPALAVGVYARRVVRRPLSELERDLLDALAADPGDVAARAGLDERWRPRELDGDGPPEVARVLAALLAAGHAASELTIDRGLLAWPIGVAVGGPLDGDPDLVRLSPRWYRVGRVLATGADGVVHEGEAVTPRSSARVALKLPRAGAHPRATLARERALLATVAHPQLPRFLGPVLHADGPGLALAWGGVDLRAVLDAARARSANLGAGFAIAVAVQVLDGLAALHGAGIVHGAVRPEHVLVSSVGAVTVVGLGHARATSHPLVVDPAPYDPEAPADPAIARQLGYIAPAQIRGALPDAAADVWAVAVAVSELPTGEHPIGVQHDGAYEIGLAILAGLEPSPALPATIREALGRALALDHRQRPTATALRAALFEAAAAASLDIGRAVIARALAVLDRPTRQDLDVTARVAPPALTLVPALPSPSPPGPPPGPPSSSPSSPSSPSSSARGGAAAPRCLCAHLAAGIAPDASSDELLRYLNDDLGDERWLFSTAPHYGDVTRFRCRRCGATVLQLRIEHEGFSGSRHRYVTALSSSEDDALARGVVDADGYEAWAGERCGIHVADGAATLYGRARVGYLGVDHRLMS